MLSSLLKNRIAIGVVALLAFSAIGANGVQNGKEDCEAGKPYCYDTPVHLDTPVNTPGFEGKPSLSADGLELYLRFRSPRGPWRAWRSGHLRQQADVGQAQLGPAGAGAASGFKPVLRHHTHDFARRARLVLRVEPPWTL